MRKAAVAFLLLFLFPSMARSEHYPERVYQRHWCEEHGGLAEYRLADGARVDCLTEVFAVEADFAHKWAESIGQALYYSSVTRKKPGILLIMEKNSDVAHLRRLKTVSEGLGITVWTMGPEAISR